MRDTRRSAAIPRLLLLGVGLLLGGTIVLAAQARMTAVEEPLPPVFATTASLDLRFEDQPDGSVLVIDAAHEVEIATLEPGTNGFARSVLRGLVRERRMTDTGGRSAFRLERMANGGLRLNDPATGRAVHLAAFGPSNVAAFERLMAAGDRVAGDQAK
jgi:putative photosynthetic complex assembly protein